MLGELPERPGAVPVRSAGVCLARHLVISPPVCHATFTDPVNTNDADKITSKQNQSIMSQEEHSLLKHEQTHVHAQVFTAKASVKFSGTNKPTFTFSQCCFHTCRIPADLRDLTRDYHLMTTSPGTTQGSQAAQMPSTLTPASTVHR